MSGLDYNTKSDLITGLQNAFNGTEKTEVHIDSTNYIPDTKSIDASALGLDLDTLVLTKNVITEYINAFAGSSDMTKAQAIKHLTVSKKCVEEIISQKLAKEKLARR